MAKRHASTSTGNLTVGGTRMPEDISFEDVVTARRRGRAVVIETPTLPSPSLSRLTEHDLWFKAENLQRTGSFKIRGAMNAIASLTPDELARGVVAASAGNHAQGVALAASELGTTATIFMPESAAIPKIVATKSYGATVILGGANLANATDEAIAFSDASGAALIHPYDDPRIVAGQGTLGIELLEQVQDVDTVIIPVGGGGLISGTALALKHLVPGIRIIGVQSDAVPTYVEARRHHKAVEITPGHTVADGIAVSRPSQLCFELIERYVDELITVDDHATTRAVALILERAKYLVEPSGAVGVAAILAGLIPEGGRTITVLSGGNVDLLLLDGVVRHGLESQGRFGSLAVTLPDEPGRLAEVLTRVGDLGANVLSVFHQRQGAGLAFGQVEIRLSLETRSHRHFNEIVESLGDYDVVATQLGRGSDSSP